jgi:hypothetical protein
MLCSYRRCPVRFSTPDAASVCDFGVGHEGPHQATTVVYWTDINGNGDPCPYLPIVLDNHSSTDRAAGPAPPA